MCTYTQRERETDFIEKKLGAKFPTYAQMQQQWREESLEEKESEEKVSKKKIKVCEKVEKSQLFWSSRGSTSGVKAAGVEPSGRMIDLKLPTAVARSIVGTKTPQVRNTFGHSAPPKVHAAVARSTLRSQKV